MKTVPYIFCASLLLVLLLLAGCSKPQAPSAAKPPSATSQVSTPSCDERVVYIDGEVLSPGPKPWERNWDALKLVAAGGGFTQFAAVDRVQLLRDGKVVQVLDCRNLAQAAARAVPIQPGDSLHVPR